MAQTTKKLRHYQDGAFSMLPGCAEGLVHAASMFEADAAARAAAARAAAAAAGAATTEPATDVCAADASLPAPA